MKKLILLLFTVSIFTQTARADLSYSLTAPTSAQAVNSWFSVTWNVTGIGVTSADAIEWVDSYGRRLAWTKTNGERTGQAWFRTQDFISSTPMQIRYFRTGMLSGVYFVPVIVRNIYLK